MNTRHAPEDSYDVVIIGAGLGGLTAGALLAKAGRSVLVCEQGEKWGGYAHSFRSGPYTFDPAIHVFAQGHEGALPDALLRHLGVKDRCSLIPAHLNYTAAFPGLVVTTPFGLEAFVEAHCRAFPEEAEAIERFFRLCHQVHHEAHELPPQIGIRDLDAVARRFPVLVKYLRATVDQVLDEHFCDPRLKGLCSVLWPYAGAPPSRLSFVTFATSVSVYLDGAFYCQGSFQSMADAFAAAVCEQGGEIALSSGVAKITVSDERASGVVLGDGQEVRAGVVVSNADARSTLEDLVGAEHLPASFVKRLRRMQPSLSAVVVFAATSLDLGQSRLAHEIFRPRHFDHSETFRDILAAKPGGMWASVPTLLDDSLAPAGEHVVAMTSLARYDIGRPWSEAIEGYADEVLAAFEVVFPGLRESLTFMDTATPATMQRYCRNAGGAAYGWENTPTQSGGKRTPHQPPLPGLFLAGHWTQPGSGSLRAIVSGLHTAQLVLTSTGSAGLEFRHPDMPPAH